MRNSPVGSVLVALDRARLVKLAESHDAVIELVHAVGDHVPGAGALLNVYGSRAIPDKQLRSALAMGDERTLGDDPAFAIRMMVDVAIKTLSPAVNDPTTAVQAIDRIEDLLRYAAAKHLSVGVVTDGQGWPGWCTRRRRGRTSSSSPWTRSGPSAPDSTRWHGAPGRSSTRC